MGKITSIMEVIPVGEIVQFDRENWRKDYKYAVYEHKLITSDGLAYSRSFIVIKNKYDVIVRFTRFHSFTGAYDNKIYRPLASDARARMHYICLMLNYVLIDHYDIYKVDHVFKVTKDMLKSFFMDYALKKKSDGTYKGSQSIEKCVHSVTLFFSKLINKFGSNVNLKRSELYVDKEYISRNGKRKIQRVPDFQIRGVAEDNEVFRDIPTKVFKIMLNLAVRYYPEISFAIGLQAFGGLRPGEVCNVRQEQSSNGPGIVFTYLDGKIVKAEVDLQHEYAMRSDGVICGKIKKERKQCIHPMFIEPFQLLYKYHLEYLKIHSYEEGYCPMFINSLGMAMTYRDYFNKFRELVDNKLRPILLNHFDPECRIYGQLISERKLSPHALRHWFSVQLALHGEDIAQLQFWRGDKNPETAFYYLQNKGDLVNELSKANDLLAAFMMREGENADI